MRVEMIGVAATAIIAAAPAQAAVVVQVDVFAKGTIERIENACMGVCSVTPTSQTFKFTDAIDLAEGQSYTFSVGAGAFGGSYQGTITRRGYDSYGNVAYRGSDFSYLQTTLLGGSAVTGAITTRLKAESFTVRQTIPAPVPEPATWLMMILGFGVVGYAMRRKTVLRFV